MLLARRPVLSCVDRVRLSSEAPWQQHSVYEKELEEQLKNAPAEQVDLLRRVFESRSRRELRRRQRALLEMARSEETATADRLALTNPYAYQNRASFFHGLGWTLPTGLSLSFLGRRVRGGEHGQRPNLAAVMFRSTDGNFLWGAGETTLESLRGGVYGPQPDLTVDDDDDDDDDAVRVPGVQFEPTDVDAVFVPQLHPHYVDDLGRFVGDVEQAARRPDELDRAHKSVAVFGPAGTAALINQSRAAGSADVWSQSTDNRSRPERMSAKDPSLFKSDSHEGYIQEIVAHRKLSFAMPQRIADREWSVQVFPITKDLSTLAYVIQEPDYVRLDPAAAALLYKRHTSLESWLHAYNAQGEHYKGRKIVAMGSRPSEAAINRVSMDAFTRSALDAAVLIHDVGTTLPAEWSAFANFASNIRARQLVLANFRAAFPDQPQNLLPKTSRYELDRISFAQPGTVVSVAEVVANEDWFEEEGFATTGL